MGPAGSLSACPRGGAPQGAGTGLCAAGWAQGPLQGPRCCPGVLRRAHGRAVPQVRVFTFSVGQHNYDVTPLQWMACANKGERGLAPGGARVAACPGACGATQHGAGTVHSRMDSRTDGPRDGGLPTCISLSFPRLLLRNPLHRRHPHQHTGEAGCRHVAAGRAALPRHPKMLHSPKMLAKSMMPLG